MFRVTSPARGICSGFEFGSLPFDAVAHNAIGRGAASSTLLIDSGGNADYDSLRVKLPNGCSTDCNYQAPTTWSHSIDDRQRSPRARRRRVSFVRNPLNPRRIAVTRTMIFGISESSITSGRCPLAGARLSPITALSVASGRLPIVGRHQRAIRSRLPT